MSRTHIFIMICKGPDRERKGRGTWSMEEHHLHACWSRLVTVWMCLVLAPWPHSTISISCPFRATHNLTLSSPTAVLPRHSASEQQTVGLVIPYVGLQYRQLFLSGFLMENLAEDVWSFVPTWMWFGNAAEDCFSSFVLSRLGASQTFPGCPPTVHFFLFCC